MPSRVSMQLRLEETHMTATAKDPPRSGASRQVDELSEDLEVAIREFLERNPDTSSRSIRQALSRVEWCADNETMRRAARVLALLAAFAVGLSLGLAFG